MHGTDQSIEEIERDFWGDAPAGATRLISMVHALRRRPVSALGVEDLRVLIAQQVGLDVLMPMALEQLERDPLVEGDFYPGDLLVAVLRAAAGYLAAHPDRLARIRAVVDGLDDADLDDETRADVEAFRRPS